MRRELSSKIPSLPALGMAIRGLRLEGQITQEVLGDRSGIHPTRISQLERGRVNPTLSSLALLSEALGVKLSELIARAEEVDREMRHTSSTEWTSARP